MSEWISVKETPPPYNERVLVYMEDVRIQFVGLKREPNRRWQRRPWLVDGRSEYGDYITHWMPLPEPPIKTTEEAKL